MGMDYVLDFYQNTTFFSDDDMADFVNLGWITQEQYDSVKAA